MLFEDSASLHPVLNSLVVPPEGGEPPAPSIEYTEAGFVVVGADHTDSGQMMIVSDAQGKALAVAFSDGDGNWDNEHDAVVSGLTCAAMGGGTVFSEGSLTFWTGAATAITCGDFVYDLGRLYTEYHQDTHDYTQSVTAFLDPAAHNGWDGEYSYTYANGGSWNIYYDTETQSYSDWVWKTGPH